MTKKASDNSGSAKGGLGPGGKLGDVVAAAAADEGGPSDGSSASPTGPIPDKLYFRIGEVAQLVGVDAHVLRYWETEFRMKPHRSPSGQRLYRKQDLSRFLRVKHLLHAEGYTIAGARKALTGQAPAVAADTERIRTALERLEALRDRIQEFRDDIEAQI